MFVANRAELRKQGGEGLLFVGKSKRCYFFNLPGHGLSHKFFTSCTPLLGSSLPLHLTVFIWLLWSFFVVHPFHSFSHLSADVLRFLWFATFPKFLLSEISHDPVSSKFAQIFNL